MRHLPSIALLSVSCLCQWKAARSLLDTYPWGSRSDVVDRAEDILESLRNNLGLHISESIVESTILRGDVEGAGSADPEASSPRSLRVKNKEGLTFIATFLDPATAFNVTERKKEEEAIELFDVGKLNAALEGSCAILPKNYWNYEWCHRKEVRQFHVEHHGDKYVLSPSWSLGRYTRSTVVRDRSNRVPSRHKPKSSRDSEDGDDRNSGEVTESDYPIVKVIEYYSGGQKCEENRKKRSTEVHIQCCADQIAQAAVLKGSQAETAQQRLQQQQQVQQLQRFRGQQIFTHQQIANINQQTKKVPLSEGGAASAAAAGAAPEDKITFSSIEEPAVCEYVATLCTPLLCRKNPPVTAAPPEPQLINPRIPGKSGSTPTVTTKQPIGSLASAGANDGEGSAAMSPYVINPADPSLAALDPHSALVGTKLAQAMALINSTCLIKQEDWWTYELCFNKALRQVRFNIEQIATKDGTIIQKQVLVSEFVLGTAPLHLYRNPVALVERTRRGNSAHVQSRPQRGQQAKQRQRDRPEISARELEIISSSGLVPPLLRARGRDPKYLSLTFSHGTPCDLDVVNRTSVVELYCGASNEIFQILEESTCHYRSKARLTVLCSVPDFMPKRENNTLLALSPLDANLDAEADMEADTETKTDGESVVNNSIDEVTKKGGGDGLLSTSDASKDEIDWRSPAESGNVSSDSEEAGDRQRSEEETNSNMDKVVNEPETVLIDEPPPAEEGIGNGGWRERERQPAVSGVVEDMSGEGIRGGIEHKPRSLEPGSSSTYAQDEGEYVDESPEQSEQQEVQEQGRQEDRLVEQLQQGESDRNEHVIPLERIQQQHQQQLEEWTMEMEGSALSEGALPHSETERVQGSKAIESQQGEVQREVMQLSDRASKFGDAAESVDASGMPAYSEVGSVREVAGRGGISDSSGALGEAVGMDEVAVEPTADAGAGADAKGSSMEGLHSSAASFHGRDHHQQQEAHAGHRDTGNGKESVEGHSETEDGRGVEDGSLREERMGNGKRNTEKEEERREIIRERADGADIR